MSTITGEGRFTARFYEATTAVFPSTGSRVPYEIGMQFLARVSGDDPDQVNAKHIARYTFVASTPQEIDLLALIGPVIRLLIVKFEPETDEDATLTFGGAALNPFAPIGDLTIYPGTTLNQGGLVWVAPGNGAPVTSGSNMLKMLPSAHAFIINFYGLGAGA